MKKANCVFLIGLILFLYSISYNLDFSSQSKESASAGADDPLKVGTTSIGYELDPAYAEDSTSIYLIDQVWEGLYAQNLKDPKLRIVPRLAADSGSWNENASVFNVTLRSGITFHNGEPFTAADVKYTFSRLWELCVFHDSDLREEYFPKGFNTTEMNASVGYGYIINKTVIVDDLHVSFELNFPYAPFQSLLCFSGSYIVDESTTRRDTFLTFANIANHTAIGTGPYRITEHSTENCTFEYWEDYYRGVPAIKKIIFVKSLSRDAISQSLLNGELDIDLGCWNPDNLQDFIDAEHIYVGPYQEKSRISYLVMNNDKINRTYRHAINYAINYSTIINERNDRKVTKMTSIIPPGISYHKDCDVPTYNITKARQILIEAGYTEDHGLNVNSTDDDWKEVAESDNPILGLNYTFRLGNVVDEEIRILIKDNLKTIGINVILVATMIPTWIYPEYTDPIYDGDIFRRCWRPEYNDPNQIIYPLMSNTSSYNYAQVNDSWLQIAMEEALTITNDDDRKALYYDIQDYITTDLMPYVFISYPIALCVHANYAITQQNSINKFYVFPFSWHGVNTTFTDPYLELWCNSGSPPVLEYSHGLEPSEFNLVFPIIFISICILAILPSWIKKYKKQSHRFKIH